MTYSEALHYLDALYNYEKNPSPGKTRFLKLKKIRDLAAFFKNPQFAYPTVHIAGTKGKGSTASTLSYILTEAGYKVGLYTSPHLKCVRERIKINNHDITKNEFAYQINKIKTIPKRINATFYETLTMAAFNYFKDSKVDIGIFEVGLGGRFDATNIIRPLVSAITPISYDHMRELGGTLKSIAAEKSEIIKPNTFCVSAPQRKIVQDVIKNKSRIVNTKCFFVEKDITYKSRFFTSKKEVFDINGILGRYKNINTNLIGTHQLVNIATACGISEILKLEGYEISKKAVKNGIEKTRWPGRCEVIKAKPLVVIDSAHNRASAYTLKCTVKRNFRYNKLILILGINKDKDIKGITSELEGIADTVILTKADTPRAEDPKRLKRYLKNKNVIINEDIESAYKISKDLAGPNDIILVTGSIYLVGEFKRIR